MRVDDGDDENNDGGLGWVGGWVLCVCVCVCVCVCGALGRPLRWLTLLEGRANCPELPLECQGARQVLSTNFWCMWCAWSAFAVAHDTGRSG